MPLNYGPSRTRRLSYGTTSRSRIKYGPEEDQNDHPWYEDLGIMALRTLPAMAGAAGAGLLAAPTGPGALAAAAAGGAAGAGIGETLAQAYEQWDKRRTGFNPTQIAAQTALGAVPLGKGASVLRNAAKGAVMGGVATGVTDWAETGDVAPSRVLTGAALGGGLTGGMAKLAQLVKGRGATPALPAGQAAAVRQELNNPRAGTRTVLNPDQVAGVTPIQDRTLPRTRDIVTPGVAQRTTDPLAYTAEAAALRDAQQRGRMPLGERIPNRQTYEEAQGVTLRDNKPVGTSHTIAQETAALAIKHASIRDKVLAGLASQDPAEIASARALAPAFADVSTRLSQKFSDIGRGLQLGKRVAPGGQQVLADGIDRAIGMGLTKPELSQMIAWAGADPIRWTEALKAEATKRATASEKVASYMTGNMLMGPKTQIRNILGNTTNLASRIALTPVRAVADALASKGDLSKRTVMAGELGAQVAGAVKAIPESFEDLLHVIRKGYSRTGQTNTGGLDVGRVEFKTGGAANPWNFTGRLLEGMDGLFRKVATESDMAGRMYTLEKTAAAKGLRRGTPAWDDAVTTARTDAETSAKRVTAQEDVGPIVGGIMRMKAANPKLAPFAQAIIPFVKTPGNLIKQGLEFTPLGFVMKGADASKVGQRAATEVQARAAAGTLGMIGLWTAAANGNLSGAGPSDPAQKARLYESGWRPNSVRVGGTWYNYGAIQPIALPVSLVANAYEQLHKDDNKPGEKDYAGSIGNTLMQTAGSLLDQSFLSGVSGLIDALQDPERFGKTWATRAAQSLVPMSGLTRAVAQTQDPTIRRPETIKEGVKTAIPGMSEQVHPRLDRFGQPVQRVGGALNRMFNVFEASPEVRDPVASGLAGVGRDLSPAAPEKTINVRRETVPLNSQDAFVLGQAKGQALYSLLKPLIDRQGFERMPVQQRELMVERMIRQARDRVQKRAANAVAQGKPLTLQDLLRGIPQR